jgi:hypothetical protein
MMSFLTYTTNFFNDLLSLADFDPLCKLIKRGDEKKKKIFSSETTEPISTKLYSILDTGRR